MNRKYLVRGIGGKQRSIAMPKDAIGYYDRIENPTMEMLSKLPKGSVLFIPDKKREIVQTKKDVGGNECEGRSE